MAHLPIRYLCTAPPHTRVPDLSHTEANLRAFLTDPQAFAPGTEMPKRALSEKDIEEIIWALKLPDDW